MSEAPRLYIRHLRQSRTCMKGSRPWFASRGWSWSDFLANGRPLQDFIDDGCPLALPAIKCAQQEVADGR